MSIYHVGGLNAPTYLFDRLRVAQPYSARASKDTSHKQVSAIKQVFRRTAPTYPSVALTYRAVLWTAR